jgi:hypothetical protein
MLGYARIVVATTPQPRARANPTYAYCSSEAEVIHVNVDARGLTPFHGRAQ